MIIMFPIKFMLPQSYWCLCSSNLASTSRARLCTRRRRWRRRLWRRALEGGAPGGGGVLPKEDTHKDTAKVNVSGGVLGRGGGRRRPPRAGIFWRQRSGRDQARRQSATALGGNFIIGGPQDLVDFVIQDKRLHSVELRYTQSSWSLASGSLWGSWGGAGSGGNGSRLPSPSIPPLLRKKAPVAALPTSLANAIARQSCKLSISPIRRCRCPPSLPRVSSWGYSPSSRERTTSRPWPHLAPPTSPTAPTAASSASSLAYFGA